MVFLAADRTSSVCFMDSFMDAISVIFNPPDRVDEDLFCIFIGVSCVAVLDSVLMSEAGLKLGTEVVCAAELMAFSGCETLVSFRTLVYFS